ncbi:DUF1194 domain-containing protein [Salinarimonas sp.]|uniref:DUF1194 domain-containing protein n=1 Tax=Salinarimonas sp. TaxID=2766526 RepID=UPI003919C00A
MWIRAFRGGRSASGPAVLLLAVVVASLLWLRPARAEVEVDVALVLGVDISFSMDMDELELQREGFVKAMRSPEVHAAIDRGLIGKIAVTYFEWASYTDRYLLVPWTLIDGPEAAERFADELAAHPIRRARRTSVSGAIDFAVGLLDQSDVVPLREVIDIAGDGPNNDGRPVEQARDAALARGATINGLPLMLKAPSAFDIPNLDEYYEDCVIGGPGAFMIPVRERNQLVEAIRTKIVLEIAGLRPEKSLVQRASDRRRVDCLVGERIWNERMRN